MSPILELNKQNIPPAESAIYLSVLREELLRGPALAVSLAQGINRLFHTPAPSVLTLVAKLTFISPTFSSRFASI